VMLRVPLVLVNTDAVPGAVNALLGRFAVVNAVSFPNTHLPRAHVTGTPVRPELGGLDRSVDGQRQAREMLGLPTQRPTLAAFGGSLGARRINAAVADLAGRWSDRDISIYHVAGRRDYAQFVPGRVTEGDIPGPDVALHYQVVPFEERMPELYRAADLCVCRAGAMTVAELLVAGAAIMVPDAECTAALLEAEIAALLCDTDRLAAMGNAARTLGLPDAAARVAELVDAHAR